MAVFSSQSLFTRLKSRCWKTVFLSGGLTEEGSTLKLPSLVGRTHFLEAAELMVAFFFKSRKKKKESLFFGISDFKECIRCLVKSSPDWIRSTQNNIPFD